MAPQALLPRADSMPQAPPHNGHGNIYYISQSHLYVSKVEDAVVWVGTFLAACFTAIRTWLQYSHNRRFYINDYFILCALLVHVVLSILYQLNAPPMYELEPIVNGFKTVDPLRLHYYDYYLRLQFALTILSWTTLWLVKLSLLTFFWRLFDSVRTHARLFWWVMCGITAATYIVSVFLQGFACLPLGSFFKFVMLTPFPLLRKLQINDRQKAILVLIFLAPVPVMIFGILRLAKTNPAIGTVDPIRLALFSTVQVSCAIMAAALPSFRLFFRHMKHGSSNDYRKYKYRKDGTPIHPPDHKGKHSLELSNVVDAFPAHDLSGSTEAILACPRDIHVRKDMVVRSDPF
ncbi:MAG: hypothetical protein OHK93_000721 [Ramalina farinacea]|uniref:Rhodopsin domain-containing protein n=1 Tax=Ramalina farinacea TaxID=258253 RepID=A0AA43TRF5_9LECA|nr:hypothetical protein [Ramalina farinacea]